MAPPDVERLVLLRTEADVIVEPAEEERHGRIVLECLHPAVKRLLEVLCRHVVPASLKTCRALPHPLQGGRDSLRWTRSKVRTSTAVSGMRTAPMLDRWTRGGTHVPQPSGKSIGLGLTVGFGLTVGVHERAIWLLVRCRPCPP